MKASDMVKKLQILIAESGDRDVMFPSEEFYDYETNEEIYKEEESINDIYFAIKSFYVE